jgi:hypothetical protein|tara:strand:- start:890 stop:1114 length:225 start_codon:yes stop_codon:yes gene_type:complete
MPAKFKPSERAMTRNSFGRMSVASGKTKPMVHHYLKCQSTKTLIDAINADRTKPKNRAKFRNELTRRGVVLVWK